LKIYIKNVTGLSKVIWFDICNAQN
jgi:hypothetical protein